MNANALNLDNAPSVAVHIYRLSCFACTYPYLQHEYTGNPLHLLRLLTFDSVAYCASINVRALLLVAAAAVLICTISILIPPLVRLVFISVVH
jgi:hypothetical protein